MGSGTGRDSGADRAALPAGTVTFLFTDIEGSTRRWEAFPVDMARCVADHDRLLRGAVVEAGGFVVKSTGDGLMAVFDNADAALVAARAGQIALEAQDWAPVPPLRVRMGIHQGRVEPSGDDYFGVPVNRAARVADSGHGGQIIVSAAAAGTMKTGPEMTLVSRGLHRLKDLSEPLELFQAIGPEVESDLLPLRTLDVSLGRLPSQLSRFVGREQEQHEVAAMLSDARLVTLVGPGGMGKTRLSLHVAEGVVGRFPQGAWFVELAPVKEAESLDHVVAAAMGFASQSGSTAREQLLDGLESWHALLVVDNCEHVLAPAGQLIGELLERCPGLSVLATSRAPLRIPGEQVFQVGPLDLRTDAPALFADRATAARPGFRLDADTEPLLQAICESLDCMPLALELAAARLRSMTAAELLDRLGERFRLLRADRGASADRHATLSAVVAWSYELLAPDAQELLDRLWVFSGGFDLAGAHAVSMSGEGSIDELDTLDLLDTLVDQSLVQAREIEGRTRYSMLETLRQYATGRCSEAERDDLRARHAAHYLAFARSADERLRGPEQAAWFRRLETEHDNLRAALAWSLGPEGDPATGLRIAAALWWFWRVRSHVEEGSRWYKLALGVAPTPETALDRVRALLGAGLLGYFQRTHESAVEVLERARDEAFRLGDDEGAGWALQGLGRILLDRREPARPRGLDGLPPPEHRVLRAVWQRTGHRLLDILSRLGSQLRRWDRPRRRAPLRRGRSNVPDAGRHLGTRRRSRGAGLARRPQPRCAGCSPPLWTATRRLGSDRQPLDGRPGSVRGSQVGRHGRPLVAGRRAVRVGPGDLRRHGSPGRQAGRAQRDPFIAGGSPGAGRSGGRRRLGGRSGPNGGGGHCRWAGSRRGARGTGAGCRSGRSGPLYITSPGWTDRRLVAVMVTVVLAGRRRRSRSCGSRGAANPRGHRG